MPCVFKRKRKKPMPEGAQIICKPNGKRFVQWTAANGRSKTARLSKDGQGIQVETATYTIQWTDENGVCQRQASKCRDRDAAMLLAREFETRAMQRREGLVTPSQERHAAATRKPIAVLAADHIKHLEANGSTKKHVQTVRRHLLAVFSAAGIVRLCDLQSARVQAAIAAMQRPHPSPNSKQPKRPASLATCNSHLRSLKGFSRWLWKQRLTPEDALLDLALFNAETDRRHIRREMTAEEVHWLLDVTEQRTLPEHGAPGKTRAMCYRLAAATGFRASELRSLTTDSFDLDTTPPTCTVEAGSSKRRKRDVQPLPEALVEPLRAWLWALNLGEKVFLGIAGNTARMLRSDLAAARAAWLKAADKQPEAVKEQMQASDFLLYRNRQGHVADFHSLRVLFISRVVAGGASVKEAQALARHSTPVLTMNTYSRVTARNLAAAVDHIGPLVTTSPIPPAAAIASQPTDAPGELNNPPVDHRIDHTLPAGTGTSWQSGSDMPANGEGRRPPPAQQKTPAKAAVVGTLQGSSKQRLRSESNRRWRICNPLP
jgi:integrase/recombinase XerD